MEEIENVGGLDLKAPMINLIFMELELFVMQILLQKILSLISVLDFTDT